MKVSIQKSTFYTTEVKWCGRIISAEGVRFDPRNIEGLLNADEPRNTEELSAFVNCAQWLSIAIPNFAERVAPLRDILDKAYSKAKKRTKKAIKCISLADLSWADVQTTAYRDIQNALRTSIRLAHPTPDKALCIYTDASNEFWAAVIAQCPVENLKLPLTQQQHEPIAFLGSQFKGAQYHWSTFEKEAFAIYQVFKRLDYLLLVSRKTHVFTDHRNLLFVFNPLAVEPFLGRHVVSKVQRWALYLSQFQYKIEHIAGKNNKMADIMTRWYKGYRRGSSLKRVKEQLDQIDIVPNPAEDDFHWPSLEEIIKAQNRAERPVNAVKGHEGEWRINGKIWIPQEPSLQIRLLVTGHCGAAGHRGIEATKSILQEQFTWADLKSDVELFVKSCILCLSTRAGDKIPRPFSSTIHALLPNEVLHFDYLYMGKGANDLKYVLVLRDDLSGYVWLVPAQWADSETTAKEISRWIRTFTSMRVWISDQGSHFKNELMSILAKEYSVHHHFVTAYTPWANGTVERCMREVRRSCEALLAELKLAPQDWPDVISAIQVILNSSPSSRLGRRQDGTFRTPLEVMTGIRPVRQPLKVEKGKTGENMSLTTEKALQLLQVEELQKAFYYMHKEVYERVTKNRLKEISWHNSKTNVISPKFEVGDFVLVRRGAKSGHKLTFRWVGPRRIVEAINSVVFKVKNLTGDKIEQVHASRLLPYRETLRNGEASGKLKEHAIHTESSYEEIEELLDIEEMDKEIYIRVKWLGLPDEKTLPIRSYQFYMKMLLDLWKNS